MSGGSMDYLYSKFEDGLDFIRCDTTLRIAFKKHCLKVAKALHDIEWVQSGDMSHPDDEPAMRACLEPGAELNEAVRAAESAMFDLKQVLDKAKAAASL